MERLQLRIGHFFNLLIEPFKVRISRHNLDSSMEDISHNAPPIIVSGRIHFLWVIFGEYLRSIRVEGRYACAFYL